MLKVRFHAVSIRLFLSKFNPVRRNNEIRMLFMTVYKKHTFHTLTCWMMSAKYTEYICL